MADNATENTHPPADDHQRCRHPSAKDRWTATVGPGGNVTLRNRRGMRVDAQIDAQGAIKGRYQGPACFVDYLWHKQGA